jgi:TolB-like protein/Flp pilus assembly protein TadD
MDVWLGVSKSPKQSITKAIELLQKAITLDDTYAEAYSALGFVFSMTEQHDKAVAKAEHGVSLNPNSADAHMLLGHTLRFAGRYEESIPEYKTAIRLNPFPPNNYLFGLGQSYAYTGQYEEAITWGKKAVRQNPNDFIANVLLTEILSLAGRDEEARIQAAEVLRISPKFTLEKWRKRARGPNKETHIDALRKAGLPETPTLPLPDKPSIAVLPFENMSDDPKQEYFSDGITDDLITDLSKISGLFVIARNSTFTYKGKPVKVQQVARELGVRYVLEGSVRKAEDKIRLNAQLIDATTGHHLWAERFDGKLEDIFALQDSFTRKIVAALAVKLTAGEEESVTHKHTENVSAYEAYLQGLEHLQRMTREDLAKAVPFFEKAIELDPDFGPAYTQFAGVYQASLITAWYRELGWSNARSLRDKYLDLAMKNPTAETHGMVALKYIYKRQHEEAVAEAERAVALEPNNSQINHLMGQSLIFAGRSAEAVDFIKKAMRLDPYYPVLRLHFLGLAQFCLGQFEEALITLESAHARKPKFGEWPLWATYAHLGREQEAANLMTKYMKRRRSHKRRATAEKLLMYYPFKDPRDEERFSDGLIKVGLPRPWNPLYRGQYEEAIAKADQAITASPNDVEAQFSMGETLLFTGRFTKAAEHIKRAITLDPKHPTFYYWYLSLAQFCQRQFEEAAVSLEKCYKGYPVESKWLLAATYAQLDRQREAEEVLTKYMKGRGFEHFTVEKVLKYDGFHAFKDPKDTELLIEGLRKAGLK